MASFLNSLELLRAGLVVVHPSSGEMHRTLHMQSFDKGRDGAEMLRLKGPSVKTIKVDVETSVTDQLSMKGNKLP